MTNVYKPYKYQKITIKEIAAKKIFFKYFSTNRLSLVQF